MSTPLPKTPAAGTGLTDTGNTRATLERLNTPYTRIGGREAIARMVDRFYDLMQNDPHYRAVRAMHGDDFAPMQEKLTDFLMQWMGGPRDWFDKNPGVCMMSGHAAYPGMAMKTANQWMAAMKVAAEETIPDRALTDAMLSALAQMAKGMVLRAEDIRGGGDYGRAHSTKGQTAEGKVLKSP